METETIIDIARQLRDMGVVWLGLTGGEPLLNRDIVRIVESVSADCAVKLFTTGCTLTNQLAVDLKNAGLFSVSVSLDHWYKKVHDAARNYRGAFREALRAIEVFKSIGGIDVGVSAVLTPEMIRSNQTGEFVRFLETLGVHEAWLSEVKPTAEVFREEKWIITEQDRLKVLDFQDRHNARGGMTVNYLGHFEGRECFGCNAGHKMVYVDAFGEVSPCVFTPMSFGSIYDADIREIFEDMKRYFPSDSKCFMNHNYGLFTKHSHGRTVLKRSESLELMDEVTFGEFPAFFKLYYGSRGGKAESGHAAASGRAGVLK